jgi:hypothetical protein
MARRDFFSRGLTKSGLFSIKSMYIDYMDDHTKYLHKYLWKIKVLLKIKVFMWFLNKNILLTKDNLIKRKWQGNEKCYFYNQKETIQHLFISMFFSKNGVAYCLYVFWYYPTKKYNEPF